MQSAKTDIDIKRKHERWRPDDPSQTAHAQKISSVFTLVLAVALFLVFMVVGAPRSNRVYAAAHTTCTDTGNRIFITNATRTGEILDVADADTIDVTYAVMPDDAFGTPHEAVMVDHETMWVSNQNQIAIVNVATGTTTSSINPPVGSDAVKGMTLGPDGRVYVTYVDDTTGKATVGVYDVTTMALTVLIEGEQFSPVAPGIEFGPDGNLYVVDVRPNAGFSGYDNVVKRYNGTTFAFIDDFTPTYSPGDFSDPWQDIVFHTDGMMYVSSSSEGKVLRYNATTGALVDTFVTHGGTAAGYDPYALEFDVSGNLMVTYFPFDTVNNIGYLSIAPDGTVTEMTDTGLGYDQFVKEIMNLPAAGCYDFGDAPDSGTHGDATYAYPTTLADDGARHLVDHKWKIGADRTVDADGQPNATATGDATGDDGVSFSAASVTSGSPVTATVTPDGRSVGSPVDCAGYVNMWVDLNADGDWNDAGEQVADGVLMERDCSLAVTFTPTATQTTNIGIRMRYSSQRDLNFTGVALDGEVEDYMIEVTAGVPYRIGNQLFLDANNNATFDVGETPIGGVDMELYIDIDGDGVFEPGGDDGAPEAVMATTAAGRYWFEGLAEEDYFVAIADTSTTVDIGGRTYDLNDLLNSSSSEPIDNDADNDDDGRDTGNAAIPNGFITMSDAITIGADAEPTNEAVPGGTAGDDETEANAQVGSEMQDDNHSNLTIDFGFHYPFDLALTKTIATEDQSVVFGDTVQFTMTVTNQGITDAYDVSVVDYIPLGFELTAANATNWGGAAVVGPATVTQTIAGPVTANGGTAAVTIDLTVTTAAPAGDLTNAAEISEFRDAAGGNIKTDIDSTPDTTLGNDGGGIDDGTSDDVIDEDAKNTADLDLDTFADGDTNQDNILDEDDHDSEDVVVVLPDLALTKTIATEDQAVVFGDTVQFTMTVTNQAGPDAYDVTIVDYIPLGFELTAANATNWGGAAVVGPATVTQTIPGPVTAGGGTATATIDLTVTTAAPAGALTNGAEISEFKDAVGGTVLADSDSTPDMNDTDAGGVDDTTSDDHIDDDGVDTNADGITDEDDHDRENVMVTLPDLALIKTVASEDQQVFVGDTVQFTMTVTNQAGPDAYDVRITDYIPAGFELTAANQGGWDGTGVGPLTVNQVIPGPINKGGGAATVTIDLVVTSTAAAGALTNTAEISEFKDAVGGTVLADSDSTPDATNGDLGGIDDGTSDDVINEDSTNIADGDGDGFADGDTNKDNILDEDDHDSENVMVTLPDIALVKTIATEDQQVYVGDTVQFTMTVTNQGGPDAYDIIVSDHIPAGFELTAANQGAWSAPGVGPTRVTQTIPGPITANGGNTAITIDLTVTSAAAAGALTNVAEVSEFRDAAGGTLLVDSDSTSDIDGTNDLGGIDDGTSDDVIDEDSTNTADADGDSFADGDTNKDGILDEDDHDSENVMVTLPDLALIKTIATEDQAVEIGDTVQFTMTVTNQSGPDAYDITVADYIPLGFELTAGNATNWGGAAAVGPATVTQTIAGPITANGGSDSITIDLTVTSAAAAGALTNTAEISEFKDAVGGKTLTDADSTPDADNTNDLGGIDDGTSDDVIDENAKNAVDGDGDSFLDGDTNKDNILDEDDHDSENVIVEYADVAVNKRVDVDQDSSFTDSEVLDVPGLGNPDPTPFQYEITVTNEATLATATGVILTDIAPPGVTIKDVASVDGGSISALTPLPVKGSPGTGDPVMWDIGTIAPGTTYTLVLNAELYFADLTDFTTGFDSGLTSQNVASITAMNETDGDSTPGNVTPADYLSAGGAFDPDPLVAEDDEDDARVTVYPALGDRVWEDTNGNGVQDAGEPGIGSVKVLLYEDDTVGGVGTDTQRGMTNTMPDGSYWFGNLTSGTDYYVVFDHSTAPASVEPTLQDVLLDAEDSDGAVADGMTGLYNLGVAEVDGTVDMGYAPRPSLGDTVWLDSNGDGIQDAGEPGIQNVQVDLYKEISGVMTMTTSDITDANGNYLFDNLDSGVNYHVVFQHGTAPASLEPTVQDNAGLDDDTDSDGDRTSGQTGTYNLTPTQEDLSVDMGYAPRPTLGDTVWLDTDGDGVQEAGEPGIQNVQVDLYKEISGVMTLTTSDITDANGNYLFENLDSGVNYHVVFQHGTAPANLEPTLQDAGSDDATDSDGDQVSGQTGTYNLSVNTDDLSVDMGYAPRPTLGDFVWHDNDGDGVQEAGEPGIQGVQVLLFQDADGLPGKDAVNDVQVDSQITDTNGAYSFANLTSGVSYYVQFVHATVSTTLEPTTQSAASADDSTDSDGAIADGCTAIYVLGLAEDRTTVDMGYAPKPSLGDTVWQDTDADGNQDAGEPGIQNVQVDLYIDDNAGVGGIDTLVTSDTTDPNGNYLFENLDSGVDYYVIFQHGTAPANLEPTTQDDGTAGDDADSDGDRTSGMSGIYNLAATQEDLSVDMGYAPRPTLGDTVWQDTDADGNQDAGEPGIENVQVILFRDADGLAGKDAVNDVQVDTKTTDANGNYLFENLDSSVAYYVQFVHGTAPANLEPTTQDDGTAGEAADSDGAQSDGCTAIYTLGIGEQNTSVDMGYAPRPTLGDTVWQDTDADGNQDAGEPGIENVQVILFRDADGLAGKDAINDVQVDTKTTDANGNYLFENLDSGVAYYVQFVHATAPANLEPTTQDDGTAGEAADSDGAQSDGCTAIYTLGIGEQNTSVDMGYAPRPTLGDTVWQDTDADGNQDAGEPGIENVQVILFRDADGLAGKDAINDVQVDTKTTDANGNYLFENLDSGVAYYVQFVHATAPAGFVPTTQDDATAGDSADSDGAVADGCSELYTLGLNEQNTSVDMGYVPRFSLGNRVWLDDGTGGGTANDGMQNGTEVGIASVSLTLLDNGGTAVDDPNQVGTQNYVVTTDGLGYYRFDNLPTGNYIVELDSTTLPASVGSSTGQTTTNTPDQKDHGNDTAVASNFRSHVVDLGVALQPTDETDFDVGNGAESALGNAASNLAIDFGFVPFADVSIEKTVDTPIYTVGIANTVTYTINVTNEGPVDLADIRVVDNAHADVVFTSWTCAVTTPGVGALTEVCGNASGAGDLLELVTLNVGGVATFTITGTIGENTTVDVNNTVNVGLPSNVTQDPNSDLPNEDSAVVMPQEQAPAISLEKEVYEGHDSGVQCDTPVAVDLLVLVDKNRDLKDVTYCFTVTNTGNTHLNSITLDDPTLNITDTDMTLVAGGDPEPIAPGETFTYYYETATNESVDNTADVTGVPTTADGTLTGQADVTDINPAQVVYVFDPPFGTKTGEFVDGQPVINWNLVWVNDSAISITGVEIFDQPPVDTTYNGNLVCTPHGISTVSICEYETPSTAFPRGRVHVVTDMGPDLGGYDLSDTVNAVQVSFDVIIDDPSLEQFIENQAEVSWSGIDGVSHDPAESGTGAPTVLSYQASLSETGSNNQPLMAVGAVVAVGAVGVAVVSRRRRMYQLRS